MGKFLQQIPLLCIGIFLSLSQMDAVPIYNSGFSNPVSMGMGSLGTGLKDPKSGIYANPGYMKKSNQRILDLGAQGGVYGGEWSPVLPGGAGFYYNWEDSNWGFFGVYYPSYTNHLPDRENIYVIQANLGLTYALSEDLYFSLALGPSGMHRFRSTSDWSLSGLIHLYYEWGNWSIGLGLEVPGSFYREDYLGGEELGERVPERLSIGLGYEWMDNMGFYGEVRRILWERGEIYRNGIEETPDWERGLGSEIGISSGIYWNRVGGSQWSLRTGLDWSGSYDTQGRNQRSLGLGLGGGYDWDLDGDVFSLELGILDRSRTARSGGRSPETEYSTSLSYRFR